jgi:hypothetical protein
MRGFGRVMRWSLLWSVLVGMLAVIPLTAVGAADPGTVPLAPPPPATASIPDHRAEQEYFASLRQAPSGTSAGQARAAAVQQARAIPNAPTLPAALGGQGTLVGKDALAPPSAVWQQLGPQPQNSNTSNPNQDYHQGLVTGRGSSVVVGPHTGVLYAGFADGGVWKSTNDGAAWTPLTDRQPTLAIGSLALDPADTTDQTLYAGTGEAIYDVLPAPAFNGDSYFGMGVLKTTDGGDTWTLLGNGLPNFNLYSATSIGIDVMVANGPVVWAGTTQGLYQSTNGGATWAQITVAVGSPNARVTDIVLDGTNMYVVLSETDNGHAYTGVYKSLTSGAAGSFVAMVSGLPAVTTWGRAQIAIARSAPQTLYLDIVTGSNVSTTGGSLLNVYKTTNGGTAWAVTTTQPPDPFGSDHQGWYDNVLAVDPANANIVYLAGVDVDSSTNGGATWSKIVDVYCGGVLLSITPCTSPIHPDNHGIGFGPSGTPRPLYIINDGGVWKTANGGTNWTDLNTNLATTQYYGGDVAANYTTNPIVIAGAQDNGTSRTASASVGTWNSILGGDGGFVSIDKTNPNIVVANYPRFMERTTNASVGTSIAWTIIQPGGSCQGGALFVSPFMIDPNASNHIVFGGGGYLCESVNSGANWVLSNFSFGSFGQAVQTATIAPANSAVIYAGTDGGRIFRTTAGNTGAPAVWSDLYTSKGLPSQPVTWIAVDRGDTTGNIAYATFGGFGVGHVWKTTDGGSTWANITHNLPDAPVTGLVTYPITGGSALVVGTDVGAFLSTNNGASWSALQNGLPNVGIDQIFTDKALTTLFVATHGRGVWKMPIASDSFAAPTVTGITPPIGSPAGGTSVTITGTGFRPGASVAFDGVAATSVVVVNATTITAVTPAHQTGVANVTVMNSDNRGGTLNQSFIFGVVRAVPPSQPAGTLNGSPPSPLPGGRPPTGPTDPNTPPPLPAPRP